MELYLTYVFLLLKIVGLNGQLAGPLLGSRGPQQQQITAAANFAVNNLNQQNRQRGGTRWYTLTSIQNSNTQSVNGLVHTINMILTESVCPNAVNYQGSSPAQCPPYKGGAVMRCSAKVWQQPMSFNFRLQNSNCSPVNPASSQTGTAQTGNTVNNQQVSPSASTNSPPQGLRDAANFATNQLNSQNRQQARRRKWYTLVDVRNPRQQTNNNMVYNMDILLAESNCPNTIAYINSSPSRCPPAQGSDSQLCSVVVTYNPTRLGYQLTNFNCQKYQQQQQQQQNSQASTLISPPSLTTSRQTSAISNPSNTRSPNTITVNVPNLRANMGTTNQQVVTQASQQNLRPFVNQPSVGTSQTIFQPQQPNRVATGPRVGATNMQVTPGFGPTMGFNAGATNTASTINPSGFGPQINRPQNPLSEVNSGSANTGSNINLSGIGSRLPQVTMPQTVNTRIGSIQTQQGPNPVPGLFGVPGQRPSVSVTGTQAQFPPRGQPINNAGLTGASRIPFQPQTNPPQNTNTGVSNSFQMGQGQMTGQGQIGVTGQQTQFTPRGQQTNNLQQSNQIDSQTRAAANFATNAYNAQMRQQFSPENKWYSLVDISNVQRQGSGGSIINMDINLQQSSCLNTAASNGATVNHCPPIPGGKINLCSVSVTYDAVAQGFRLLSSTCRDPRPQQMGTGSTQSTVSSSTITSQQTFAATQPGATSATPTSSNISESQKNAKIRRAASTATNEINVQSRQNNANDNKWYTLVEIQDPKIQIVGGSVIDMNLVLSQSNCLNVAANIGASNSRCPASIGGLKKMCSVKVWHESFNVEDKLLSFSCQQSQTSVVEGPTVQQQTQQQSMSISGLQPAQTASSVIPGAVLSARSSSQNPIINAVNSGIPQNSMGSSVQTSNNLNQQQSMSTPGLQPAQTASSVITGAVLSSSSQSSTINAVNSGFPQNNMGSPVQTSNNLNQGAGSSKGSPRVIDVANFATNEINTRSKSLEQSWFTLVDIANATRQELIAGGWMYQMEIMMYESTCQNIESNFDASNLQCPEINGGRVRTCKIEVLDQPNVPGLQLEKMDCMLNARPQTGPNNMPLIPPLQHQVPAAFGGFNDTFSKPPSQAYSTQSQVIQAAAHFAVNKINEQNKKPNAYRYVLVNIHNPQEKSFGGLEYRMNLMLQESTCPNTPVYIDATAQLCPPRPGGHLRLCDVKVLHQPWTFGYRLENVHCLNQ